jgi:hypothetical protein
VIWSKRILWVLFLGILYFNLSGCGYTSRSSIYPENTTIFIKPFANKIDITNETSEYNRLISYFPMLETKVTNAVVDRFLFDGNLKVAKTENADLVLESEITRYNRDALQYQDDNETVTEYRVSIFISMKLVDTKTGREAWQENNFAGETTYYMQGPRAKSETAAVADAVEDLARRIVERVVESW